MNNTLQRIRGGQARPWGGHSTGSLQDKKQALCASTFCGQEFHIPVRATHPLAPLCAERGVCHYGTKLVSLCAITLNY